MGDIRTAIFDVLYRLGQQLPGSRLSERTYEWVRGGGNHSQTVECDQATLETAWQGRPLLVQFQTDPPPPDLPGAELFLSSKQVAFDLKLRPRGFFDWLPWLSGLRPESPSLRSQYTFLCPTAAHHPAARELLKRAAELEEELPRLPWGLLARLDFQEGAGLSGRYRPHVLQLMDRAWLDQQAEVLARLLLLCP
ncbi:MAG TPA: hypothetical protein PK668_18025 [Myxococcota bacterium]|nr:hypothetical protein [Myxococcota bacterium]HRY95861.1 hypothetical protein [Myxococcota bacterium]HSA23854.1 hypothetical protein [Myxococcota bacterium]